MVDLPPLLSSAGDTSLRVRMLVAITLAGVAALPVLAQTGSPGCDETCPAELTGDGFVDGQDLGALLAAWGASNPGCADLDGSGAVDGGDLGVLLSTWGPCRLVEPCPPAANDCCAVSVAPGCADAGCCDAVCAADPSCCAASWDQSCVRTADAVCGLDCQPADCDSAGHECCEEGGPGCSDFECCAAVCASDPACCELGWDVDCVDSAETLCDIECLPDCAGADHDCCTEGGSGCADVECCQAVCRLDPSCCAVAWDATCVEIAELSCGLACQDACDLADHDCCLEGGPGCTDETCCDAVCAQDRSCCAIAWDAGCVDLAVALCGLGCGSPCVGADHDCCEPGGPGCTDVGCCEAVCAEDPFCCIGAWDSGCISLAKLACAISCPSTCAAAGHTCCTTGLPGCSDVACCELVCSLDPFCCDLGWDGQCIDQAVTVCGLDCIDMTCAMATHDCCAVGGPGCANADCCELVCAGDPACCERQWDESCTRDADSQCGLDCGR